MTKFSLIATASLLPAAIAFSPIAPTTQITSQFGVASQGALFAEVDDKAAEAVFLPADEGSVDEDATFAKVERLGKGAAKVSVVPCITMKVLSRKYSDMI